MTPLILMAKQILQDLCRNNADWEDPIGENLRLKWKRWRNELHELEKLKIPRCHKPENFGEIKAVEVHHFSDILFHLYPLFCKVYYFTSTS